MAIDFEIFLEVYRACSFQESLLSIITPRNLECSTTSSDWSFILIFIVRGVLALFGPNMMECVFLIFKDRRLALSHSKSLGISSFICVCNISRFGPETNKLESSANNNADRTVEKWARSFMYTKNKRGPRIDIQFFWLVVIKKTILLAIL